MLAIYSAVQTGETRQAVALVLALTALACAVLVMAGRRGARTA
jgi:ABC-type molybdate transport system permease subunit